MGRYESRVDDRVAGRRRRPRNDAARPRRSHQQAREDRPGAGEDCRAPVFRRNERRGGGRCDGYVPGDAQTSLVTRARLAVSRAEPVVTPEQRRRARDLFEAALDHEPAGALQWLNEAEPQDSDVREEVRSLLDHHSRAGVFLDQPLVEAAPYLLDDDRTLEPGAVLGPYTVLRELGRGGMGR